MAAWYSRLTWRRNADWRDYSSLFHSAAQVCPRSAKVQYNLAHWYAGEGEQEQAMRHYEQAVRIHPAYYQALANLAALHSGGGEPEQATALYRRALATQPSFGEAYYNLGFALQRRGLAEEALPLMQHAARLQPYSAIMAQGLGNALRGLGAAQQVQQQVQQVQNLQEALGEYRRAIRIDPSFASAYNNLAACLLSLSSSPSLSSREEEGSRREWALLHEAEASYQSALALTADVDVVSKANFGLSTVVSRLAQVESQPGMGSEHGLQGAGPGAARLSQSAKYLLRAVRADGSYAKAYHALGNLLSCVCTCVWVCGCGLRTWLCMQQLATAHSVLSRCVLVVLILGPHACLSMPVSARLAASTATGHRRGGAEMALGFAVRLFPESADFCNSLAANLHLDGRYEDALNWYAAAQRLKPELAGAWSNAGNALMLLQRCLVCLSVVGLNTGFLLRNGSLQGCVHR